MAGVFTMVSDGSVHSMMLLAAGVVVLLVGVPEVSDAVLQVSLVVDQCCFWHQACNWPLRCDMETC